MPVRALTIGGAVLTLVAGLAFPWLKTPAIVALCYGLAALGVAVLMRAGQASFGHAMYACIAGYTVGFLGTGLSGYGRGAPHRSRCGGERCGGAGRRPVRRPLPGVFLGMLNLAISMVLLFVARKALRHNRRNGWVAHRSPNPGRIRVRTRGFETVLLVVALGLAIVLGWLVQRFFGSAAGEALAGVKTNETRLEYLGLSAGRTLERLRAFGGPGRSCRCLSALLQGLITPESGYLAPLR